MGNLRRRIKNLEAASPPPEDLGEIKHKMFKRVRMAILDEYARIRAPRHIPGQKNPKDRIGPPLVVELYGPAYTTGQFHELATRRAVFDRLEECLSSGFITSEDFTQYLEPEDLTPEGREKLVQTLIGLEKEWLESQGIEWDEVNRWERERREKALREEWEV
jgi:hypothetical protein